MNNISVLLDAVSPIVLVIPAVILMAIVSVVTFCVLWLIAYIKRRNQN